MSAPPLHRPLLEVRDLVVRYGPVVAVDGADLAVGGPGVTALVGPSGCGKTSLLRAVAGFEVPAAGTVVIDGEVVATAGRAVPPERRQVGMVFQQGALFPHLTVRGNVAYGVRGRPDARRRVEETLALVGMADLASRSPHELSGGQLQRVALARALAPSPRLVLLDEPFASLDAALRRETREEVVRILHRARITALLVTHDQEEALSVADRLAVMEEGRILQVGPPEEVYRLPANPQVARFVGDGQLVACEVRAGRALSWLGTVPSAAPAGPGWILVRPEDIEILPESAAGGAAGIPGTVVGRRFFGHDLLCSVRLAGGRTLDARVLSSSVEAADGRVRVALRPRLYTVFPRAAEVGSRQGA